MNKYYCEAAKWWSQKITNRMVNYLQKVEGVSELPNTDLEKLDTFKNLFCKKVSNLFNQYGSVRLFSSSSIVKDTIIEANIPPYFLYEGDEMHIVLGSITTFTSNEGIGFIECDF